MISDFNLMTKGRKKTVCFQDNLSDIRSIQYLYPRPQLSSEHFRATPPDRNFGHNVYTKTLFFLFCFKCTASRLNLEQLGHKTKFLLVLSVVSWPTTRTHNSYTYIEYLYMQLIIFMKKYEITQLRGVF